eukprot:CAMPEP_0185546398 /NCGR_PEP_ID=MMETSP1381-20130426/5444_1 /TAXON_ID=298111 /ORGANISM="Pavlova sp., Strain CCMP459" /LENGTH=106 /DNA_ID=CAMNT_0028158833 /DNA_START=191 /DNA_END=512 /DNA_ORIENTATION=+
MSSLTSGSTNLRMIWELSPTSPPAEQLLLVKHTVANTTTLVHVDAERVEEAEIASVAVRAVRGLLHDLDRHGHRRADGVEACDHVLACAFTSCEIATTLAHGHVHA